MSELSQVSQLLEQSLNSSTSKNAELQLKSLELSKGFSLTLLHIVALNELALSIRLASALYFKNLIKRKWIDESGVYLIDVSDAILIKKEIVGLMIQLPDQLQVQIGESISLIAESEFPELWPELLDELVSKLSLDDLIMNKGVLKVAHSIFKRWRPLFRSDELFLEIKMVLDKFSVPFLEVLKSTDTLIEHNMNDGAKLKLLFENLLLLVKIYYDLNCQDIPEFFEDNIQQGMGIMLKYLKFHSPLLEDASEDEEIDLVTSVKINICDLIQLYTTRYQEEFDKFIPSFIEIIWTLLNDITIQQKYDILTSKSLQFLTAITNIDKFSKILNNDSSIKGIIEKIILPNITIREIDEEMFEDDPIEFTRRDLEGSDIDSRRRSCTEFLRALKENNETLITNEIMIYINHYLNDYQNNKINNWKSKDLADFLFCAIASKGSMTNSGITSINLLVDIVKFFADNIYPDLVNEVPHPILKVDAIKYIFIFRNQLTKEQLIQTFPLLSLHFQSDNYVVYTYTAITIEKILSSRNPNNYQEMMFNKTDIPSHVSNELLMNLFRLMFKKGETPEKLAENEFLMKCIMRVLLNSEDSLSESIIEILQQLLKVIDLISKNPSNPKFSHYAFESVCVILKFYKKTNLQQLFELVKPLSFKLLGENVEEFIPYVFQILSYILENYPTNLEIPTEFEQLIKPLSSPQIWECKANIPAIERLLSSIIKFKPTLFTNMENLTPILGVYQKLITSNINYLIGFDFLESLLVNLQPLNILSSYLKEIGIILLTKLQNFRTEKFLKRFIIFISKISSFNKPTLNSKFIIDFIENIQVGLFDQILNNFVLPFINKFNNLTDKKILVTGLTNLSIENISVLNKDKILSLIRGVIQLLASDSIKDYKPINENIEIMMEIENDELSFGSTFNKLNIIGVKPWDPVFEIKDKNQLLQYFKNKLQSVNGYQDILSSLDNETQLAAQSIGL